MRKFFTALAFAFALPAYAGGPAFTSDLTITGSDPDIVLTDNTANEADWEICLDDTGCNATGTDGRNEAFHVKWVDGGTPQIPFIIENGTSNYLLYLDAAENIGINTSTPSLPLVILDSSPEIHLDDTSMDAGEAYIQMSTNTLTLEGIGGVDVIEYDVRAPVTMDIDELGTTTFFGDMRFSSSLATKAGIQDVGTQDVLSRLADLPIHRWHYKREGESRQHMGPMAEDFYAAFGLGQGKEHISVIDSTGVALAAVQALASQVETLQLDNRRLKAELNQLRLDAADNARLLELERRLALFEQSLAVTAANR